MKKSYSKKQNDVSKIAKALGHPARVAILELLSGKELTCNQIVEELPLAQATVSQHLKELKNSGLIDCKYKLPKSIYSIKKNNVAKSTKEISGFLEVI